MEKPSEIIRAIMQDIAAGQPILEYGKIVRTGGEGDCRFIYSLSANGVVADQKVVFSLVGEKAGRTSGNKDVYYNWEHTFGVRIALEQETAFDVCITKSAFPYVKQMSRLIERPEIEKELREKNGPSFSIDDTLAVVYHFDERKAKDFFPFIVPKQPLLQLLRYEESEFLRTKDNKHFCTYVIRAPFLHVKGPNDEGGVASLYQQTHIPSLALKSSQKDCASIRASLESTERLLRAIEKYNVQ